MKRSALALLIVAAFPATAHAQALTVYSSLPLSGASRPQTRAVNDGARLALQQAGGQAAGRPVRLVTLNDATPQAGSWTPERTARNALKAAQDKSTMAYIGEFNSGASRISLPILNETGIPMVSPSNTYNGMTTDGAGTERGEPDKYYPVGGRSYFRLLPNDHVQAAALVTAARDHGCTRLALLHDGEIYGRGVAIDARATAARIGVAVALTRRASRRASNYRALARKAKRAKADCVVYGGITANNAVRVFKDFGRALRKAQFFGSDGVAESGFASRLPRSVAKRTHVTVATLLNTVYGLGSHEDPYKALGYEAMKVIIDGINAVGPDRTALINWLHTVQNRPSAIGTYGFDTNGDTTLRAYGLYRISGKELAWEAAVTAA
jgi:branched-chain amino acid transport system substrate-binding protein